MYQPNVIQTFGFDAWPGYSVVQLKRIHTAVGLTGRTCDKFIFTVSGFGYGEPQEAPRTA